MRRILVDTARRKQSQKRGGGHWKRVDADLLDWSSGAADHDVLPLDEALVELAEVDGRAEKHVELRYFGGLTIQETAQTLKASVATAKRDWAYARAWLNCELSREQTAAFDFLLFREPFSPRNSRYVERAWSAASDSISDANTNNGRKADIPPGIGD